MVLFAAGVVGAFGAAYGAAVGLVLALVLIFVIDRQSFGWVIGLHVPWLTLGQGLALVLCAALLGGLYPARVAARIRADEAVRSRMRRLAAFAAAALLVRLWGRSGPRRRAVSRSRARRTRSSS